MQKTLGGERLGTGKKMKVDLHGYDRSTHDLGRIWRSTMSAGTLVPFLKLLVMPGDTIDMKLEVDMKTLPTVGPLFSTSKVELHIFEAPIRLYQGMLHNNKLGIGLAMQDVKLPILNLTAPIFEEIPEDIDNCQINPSCILSYLGIRGIKWLETDAESQQREFNAVPYLAYVDIYKNYYSNKMEEIGAVIHATPIVPEETVDTVEVNGGLLAEKGDPETARAAYLGVEIEIAYTGTPPIPSTIMFTAKAIFGGWTNTYNFAQICDDIIDTGTELKGTVTGIHAQNLMNWYYITPNEMPVGPPQVRTFPLVDIDTMREQILSHQTATPFNVSTQMLKPYEWVANNFGQGANVLVSSQEGLLLKTYLSDIFNNWLNTEYIDGTNGINEITAIDTSEGSFTIETFILSKKIYDMLNRVMVSGGTYDDWLDVVYDTERIQRAETPIYHGGLTRELIFQEVVSNSTSETEENGSQPLGTLAGKGVMGSSKKGGDLVIRVNEPGYLIGIISITPRIDYSQGNDFDVHLETLNDIHKPPLDEIGFQELITERMAWWSTYEDATGLHTKSAGKQPAWIEYMTAVNEVRGNFAIRNNSMFMVQNRRYELGTSPTDGILDLTTYIDPSKFNYIFAQTSLDAQNYMAQVAMDITARRKMSYKLMPNL